MNVTPQQAKLTAIERAKIAVIEKEFGTVVGVSNYTEVSNQGEHSSVKFLSLGESEVKGEWLETIGEPVVTMDIQDNLLVVIVSIKGRIRELKMSRIDYDVKVLRNGITDRCASSRFRSGDDLFVSFEAPVDGYVAVYLYDLNGVNRLLPTKSNSHSSYYLPGGTRYIFFENGSAGVSRYADLANEGKDHPQSMYCLTCSGASEVNRCYIIFSPNKFTTPNDEMPQAEEAAAFLDFESFQRWLAKCRRRDRDMSLKIMDIVIQE